MVCAQWYADVVAVEVFDSVAVAVSLVIGVGADNTVAINNGMNYSPTASSEPEQNAWTRDAE